MSRGVHLQVLWIPRQADPERFLLEEALDLYWISWFLFSEGFPLFKGISWFPLIPKFWI